MGLSCILSQRRPFQEECRRQVRFSPTQQKVGIPLPFSPFAPLCLLRVNGPNLFFTTPAPPTWNTEATPQNITFDTHINSDFNNQQSNTLDHYLVPQQPRTRSKSDTSTRPPTWDVASLDPSSHNDRTNVNLESLLPSTNSQSEAQISFSSDIYQSGFTNPSPQPGMLNQYNFTSESSLGPQFLSPDMAFGAPSLRRVRSDGGRPSHRYSKSEGGISYPPSAHSEFIARTAADNFSTVKQQFLQPSEPIPSIRGHHRRSSSGSRDRGIGGMGLHSAPGSSRASPYPSPRASPLLGCDPLPAIPNVQSLPPPTGLGRGRPTSMPAYGPSSYGIPPGGIGELDQQMNSGPEMTDMGGNSVHRINSASSAVSKPNVTTTATAEASERRRKTDANFVCPVPGCGSTFTRHFNLKGASYRPLRAMSLIHLRRPYAFAQRREAIPVQVARVRERLCKSSRLQAPRAASFQLPAPQMRGLWQVFPEDGRAQPAS